MSLADDLKLLGAPVKFGDYIQDWHAVIRVINAAQQAQDDLERARHLAKHLFLMIPREEWRNAGAIGPGGEVEGYYWAADIEEEIRGWGDDPGRTELRS